ncbi:MAG: hypothetical protein ACI9UU_001950 [Candidatus Azotimanducaceae bacterium]|jgi:hypothetical protein
MTTEIPENSDLAWDLDDFAEASRAMEFVMQFEQTLCVYSPSVQQIYSNYNMFFPDDWDRKLVILPDASAFHDTFFNVDKSSITATGLYIVPGELIERTGLYLANIDENRNLGKRQIPFEAGLKAIISQQPDNDPFLPVLAKGDLRELEQSWPVMHLHRVNPAAIEHMSNLDRTNLSNVISEKLDSLFYSQQSNVA